MTEDKLSYKIIGAIFEVHKILGCGLLEECYQSALMRELQLRGLNVKGKVSLPVFYKGVEIKHPYEMDILVEDSIVLELKSVEHLEKRHFKQLINYLRLSDHYLGFLINFNTDYLENNRDIHRLINRHATKKLDM